MKGFGECGRVGDIGDKSRAFGRERLQVGCVSADDANLLAAAEKSLLATMWPVLPLAPRTTYIGTYSIKLLDAAGWVWTLTWKGRTAPVIEGSAARHRMPDRGFCGGGLWIGFDFGVDFGSRGRLISTVGQDLLGAMKASSRLMWMGLGLAVASVGGRVWVVQTFRANWSQAPF